MFYLPTQYDGSLNLQGTLSSATADTVLAGTIKGPHHPISCSGQLYIDEDNGIRCDHATAPPDNPRNQAIFDATIAILLFEEAYKKFS